MKQELNGAELALELPERIDTLTANGVEKEIQEICAATPHEGLCLRAGALKYIASSGLRIMVRLAKTEKRFRIVDVEPGVYSVFETTGFTQIMQVEKALRKIDLDTCQQLGIGGTGAVYRISPEEIVKVNYNPATDAELEEEARKAKEAFILGVPTAITFDRVDCGEGRRGVVYETLHSITLGEMLQAHPEQMDEWVERYVETLRQLHAIHTDNPVFGSVKEDYRRQVEATRAYLTPEEGDLLADVCEALPEGGCLVHGDAHPKNIMLQDGEMMWIDMAMMGVGHPIYDLISIAVVLKGLSTDELALQMTGMTLATLGQLDTCFVRHYFGAESAEELARYGRLMDCLRMIRTVFMIGCDSPTTQRFRPRMLQFARGVFFPQVEQVKEAVRTLLDVCI
ncbi:MAG: phosphotransferase [Bacteroidales bacterium]|nr:phosphotransferase [Bacteroidales bacterium]